MVTLHFSLFSLVLVAFAVATLASDTPWMPSKLEECKAQLADSKMRTSHAMDFLQSQITILEEHLPSMPVPLNVAFEQPLALVDRLRDARERETIRASLLALKKDLQERDRQSSSTYHISRITELLEAALKLIGLGGSPPNPSPPPK